jgi:predicted metal-dependent peptidase
MAIVTRLENPHKIVDDETLARLDDKLSRLMTRLALRPEHGGNPFLFAMTVAKRHELVNYTVKGWGDGVHKDADENKKKGGFHTAATNGKKYFWDPEFLDKLTVTEATIVMMHECYHVLFLHCQRFRGANKNIAAMVVDWVVNSNIEKEYQNYSRPGKLWDGEFKYQVKYKAFLDYIDGITDKYIEKEEGDDDKFAIFADVAVYGRGTEELYEEIMDHIDKSPRKCHECGELTIDPKTGQSTIEKPWEEPCCPNCGLPYGESKYGESLDSHIEVELTEQEIRTEAMKAAEQTQIMRGELPSGIEELIGDLLNPKLKFTDLIRNACLRKVRNAGMNNDFKRYRKRWLSMGVYMPKKFTYKPKWLCMLDTSGSMSNDDLVYGLSQLKALDKSGMEGSIVCCDAEVYWDKIQPVSNISDLSRLKILGRGGTVFDEFFKNYPNKIGSEWDCIIIITDGGFGTIPANLKPRCEVVWVITNSNKIEVPFGRLAPLRHESR